MIDTHSHLLPWVDHGCPNLETSVSMAREAAASGIHTVVCTPHLPEWDAADVQRARVVIEQVRAALLDAGVEITLLLGFEVDLSVAATVDNDRLWELTIEGSKGAILLEMPYSGWPVFMEDTIFRLASAGFVPVLAHPERNDRIHDSSQLLMGCLKAGAVAQATAGSLGGEFGRASVRTLYRLFSEGLISLVGSDAHADRKEGWTLGPMLKALEGLTTEESIRTLMETNPRRLLGGKAPTPVMPAGEGRSVRGRTRRPRLR